MDVYRFSEGDSPLLVSVPHAGTQVPAGIAARFTPEAEPLADTDWHVDRLYDFAPDLGCSMLVANCSRYVVDVNRPPDDESLYPGQATTGLVPVDTFDGAPIYGDGDAPDAAETAERLEAYWRPYHDKLRAELDRIRARHGFAVLWDAHSIRSHVPRLFEGRLPDLNFGTNSGASCAESLIAAVMDELGEGAGDFTHVRDARFRGGYITRNYGRPADGVHALQLEIAQAAYMDERPPFPYDADMAAPLRALLQALVTRARDWRP